MSWNSLDYKMQKWKAVIIRKECLLRSLMIESLESLRFLWKSWSWMIDKRLAKLTWNRFADLLCFASLFWRIQFGIYINFKCKLCRISERGFRQIQFLRE